MAFKQSHGSTESFYNSLKSSSTNIETPSGSHKMRYYAEKPSNNKILHYINQGLFRYNIPTPNYIGLDTYVFVSSDKEKIEYWKNQLSPGIQEIIVFIHDRIFSDTITMSNERDVTFTVLCGDEFGSVFHMIKENISNSDMRKGMDTLLGYGYETIVDTVASTGSYIADSLTALQGVMKLDELCNSLFSYGSNLFNKLKSSKLIFGTVEEYVTQLFPIDEINALVSNARVMIETETETALLSFNEKAQATIQSISDITSSALRRAPQAGYLFQLLWKSFNQQLQTQLYIFELVKKLAVAKNQFESSMAVSFGDETLKKLFGPEGNKIRQNSGKIGELAVSGALFGQLPFLIGTIYQIIYDIINTIIQVVKFAYWSLSGIFSYLMTPSEDEEENHIVADKSVLEMFLFDFNLENFFFEDVPNLIKLFAEMAQAAIDSFIEHASEYGTAVGKIISDGVIFIVDGALSLMTKSYPKKPTILNRLIWNATQWFNIGALLGPIIVDIALMVCSGGGTGIFSAAAKLGKVGKIGDFFRFVGKTKNLIEKAAFFSKWKKIIPKALEELIEKILRQMWALIGEVRDTFMFVIKFVNAKLGDVLKKRDIDKIAEKLDMWYDIASLIHLFGALVFMFIGGPAAKVNEKGKIGVA